MRSIDIHAHLKPQCYRQAVAQGKAWHSLRGEGGGQNPRAVWTPEQRIADMDSLGVDVQVVSTTAAFYRYELDPAVATAIAKDCNNEVCQMTKDYPSRFAGFCTLPMQDVVGRHCRTGTGHDPAGPEGGHD